MKSRNMLLGLLFGLTICLSAAAQEVFPLGSDRELFCDDTMVASMSDCQILVHQPVPQEVAIMCDKPWEGNNCGYWTVLYDDQAKIFRAYAKACSINNGVVEGHGIVITTYESEDGIHWTRPNLGLFEKEGSTDNNVVINEAVDHTDCPSTTPLLIEHAFA